MFSQSHTNRGVSSFLFAHVPLAMDLLNFQGATAASSVAMLGVNLVHLVLRVPLT